MCSIRSAGGLHWFAHGAESFDFYDETDETGLDKCSPLAYNLSFIGQQLTRIVLEKLLSVCLPIIVLSCYTNNFFGILYTA